MKALILAALAFASLGRASSSLPITVGAIITLAILMLTSARVDWSEKFRRKPRFAPPAVV